jgi:membrane protein YqaA with SNARE-associated domain
MVPEWGDAFAAAGAPLGADCVPVVLLSFIAFRGRFFSVAFFN